MPLALLAAMALLAGPPAVQQASPTQEKICFCPRPGLTLTYHLDSNLSSKGANFTGKDLSFEALASGEVQLSIRQAAGDKVFTALSSPGINVDVRTPLGPNHFVLMTKKGMSLRAVFDRQGNLVEAQNTRALNTPSAMNISIIQILRDYFPIFPARPVSVGDSWENRKKITVPFQGMDLVVSVKARFTFLGIQFAGTERSATISTEYSVELGGTKPLGTASGSFQGKGVGSGLLDFRLDEGYFNQYRFDYRIDASFVMTDRETKLLEVPFSLGVSASVLLIDSYLQPRS